MSGPSFCIARFPTAMPDGPAFGTMERLSWPQFTKILAHRRVGEKDGPSLVFARFMPEPDGRVRRLKANVLARTAIALDIETNKETGEIAPQMAEAEQRIKARGWCAAIYSSHNHTAAAPRYRIILPVTEEIAPNFPAPEAAAEALGLAGVLDTSKIGAASLFYLPSADKGRLADHATIIVDGAPIHAEWMQERAGAILAAREAEQARQRAEAMAAAEARRAARSARGQTGDENLIAAIRDRLDLEGELLRHGYEKKGKNIFLYPHSQTGNPGVHIMTGTDGVQRVYSHHNGDPLAACNLPSWCTVKAIDAVDVVTILDLAGDRKKALHTLATRFGIGARQQRDEIEPPEYVPQEGELPPGGTQTSDQQKASHQKAGQKRPRFTPLTPAECETGLTRPYVIKNLVARGDHAQFIGAPGSGKSALAPLAGYCIALGIPFLGRRVKQGPVIYIAAEDGHGMQLRVRALRKRFGDTSNFLLVPDAPDLMDPNSGDEDRIARLIQQHKPVAVFLDTIARAFPGRKENESDSMGRVVRVARRLAAEDCEPAVISVHHIPKSDTGSTASPRGHGILAGDLDVVVLIQGEKAEVRSVQLGKNRNGPSDSTFAFNIETEDFGEDEDGDLITAPIAAPVEAATTAGKAKAEAGLRDAPALMLREIRDLTDRYGSLTHIGDGAPKVLSITRALLRSRLIDRGWFADHLLSTGNDGKTTLLRTGYGPESTALKALKRRGIISHNQQHVWLL